MSNLNESDALAANAPLLDAMEIFVNSKFKKPAMANMMLYEGKDTQIIYRIQGSLNYTSTPCGYPHIYNRFLIISKL